MLAGSAALGRATGGRRRGAAMAADPVDAPQAVIAAHTIATMATTAIVIDGAGFLTSAATLAVEANALAAFIRRSAVSTSGATAMIVIAKVQAIRGTAHLATLVTTMTGASHRGACACRARAIHARIVPAAFGRPVAIFAPETALAYPIAANAEI